MSIIRRFIGLLLIIAAIGGLLFSILAIISVWRIQPAATQSLQNGVELLSATLGTTAQGLVVTQNSLEDSVASIQALQITVETTAKTFDTTEPIMDAIVTMMAEDMPDTIRATQSSLYTAQQSAKVIDSVLGTLSGLPIIGGEVGYDPDVPLDQALGEVSASLDDLPGDFIEISKNLDTTSVNLQVFQDDLDMVADSIRQIETSVAQYKDVISGYQTSLEQVQLQLDQLSMNMAAIMNSVTWGLTIFLVWMAIAQLGLFTQGWELLSRRSPKQPISSPELRIEEGSPEKEKDSR